MAKQKDILLDENNDLLIVNGDFVIGESQNQEVSLIAGLKSGELKSDPILGPNLIQLVKSNASLSEIEQRLRVHLARDNKDFEEVKKQLKIN